MVLISCPSSKNHLVCLFQISVIIMLSTAVIIISMVISMWSWKTINCSMIWEAPYCSHMFRYVVTVGSNKVLHEELICFKCFA